MSQQCSQELLAIHALVLYTDSLENTNFALPFNCHVTRKDTWISLSFTCSLSLLKKILVRQDFCLSTFAHFCVFLKRFSFFEMPYGTYIRFDLLTYTYISISCFVFNTSSCGPSYVNVCVCVCVCVVNSYMCICAVCLNILVDKIVSFYWSTF